MKLSKKLFAAAATLGLAVAATVGSTYAWFSMNTTVTATGMQVTAKSDNTFLLISATNTTAANIQTEGAITVALTVTDEESKVYPSKPMEESEVGAGNLFETGTAVTDTATAAVPANWYTANSSDPASSTMDTNSANPLGSFAGYVITKTVYLTVAEGANDVNNLKVTPTITAKDSKTIDAAKILVITSDGGFATLTSTMSGTSIDIKGVNTNLSDETVLTVNIYIYYDGSDASVNTNNVANLDGATIDLAFNVDAVPAT
ncbi:MAG: hypothetical protein ACOX0I_04050 [Bacilli bacterium]|jgi:hypothetical protein